MAGGSRRRSNAIPATLRRIDRARLLHAVGRFSDTHMIPALGTIVMIGLGVPHTDWDYQKSYRHAPVQIHRHEMGQMPVYPCWDGCAGTGRTAGVQLRASTGGPAAMASAQSRELQQASGASNRIIYKGAGGPVASAGSSGMNWLRHAGLLRAGQSAGRLVGCVLPNRRLRHAGGVLPTFRQCNSVPGGWSCWSSGGSGRRHGFAHWGAHPLENPGPFGGFAVPGGDLIAQGQQAARLPSARSPRWRDHGRSAVDPRGGKGASRNRD